MLIPVAEYRPDVAELNSTFTGDINNVLCAASSYIPFPTLAAYSGALAEAPAGAPFVARDLSGTVSVFVGTATNLYRLNNTTFAWDDVSQALTTYSASADAPWDFDQFGDYVVAVNANDDPQVFQLGVSTEFADLAGSPPRAAFVRVWGDFLVLLRLTSNPDRIQWSGLNDIEQWTPGTNSSDFQTFPDGGVVQGASRATNPVIFQQSAIRRGTFVPGSIEVFTFQKIHDRRGAKSPYSIATRGAFIFYADEGGFFQITSDGAITPIGFEKVDRTWFAKVSAANIELMRGVVDPFYSRVYWAVTQGAGPNFDTLLIYDWNLQRWSKASVDAKALFPAATVGLTLEGLDTISASLDALPFSLDSKAWQGGAPLLAAIDGANQVAFFSGEGAEATVTTQEMGDTAGQVTTVNEVYPVVDFGPQDAIFVSLGGRLRRNNPVNWLPEAQPSFNTGMVRKRSRARFHRVKVRIPAGANWTHFQGVDAKMIPSGMR